VKVPFTWKVTGWFMVGWSPESPKTHFLSTVFGDLQIWRYQKYVENTALSRGDTKGYMALRKWAPQCYEVPA
jgi:hypothetical protein